MTFNVPKQFERQQRNVHFMFPNQSPGMEPYLVYTCLLTQEGADAPIATVIRNTFGRDVIWSRVSEGVYRATLDEMFPEDYTFIFKGLPEDGFGSRVITGGRTNNDSVTIQTTIDGDIEDGLLSKTFLEIRIYFPNNIH